MDISKFKSLNELKVYTHISENLDKNGNWFTNHIEYQEIADKYLISKSTSIRCINDMTDIGLLVRVSKGIYKLYENV